MIAVAVAVPLLPLAAGIVWLLSPEQVRLRSLIVTEQIIGAICERLERATMVAHDSIVFFPAPI